MYFTDGLFAYFLVLVFAVHWLLPRTLWRNAWLLAASYLFYGWVHPWFCILLALTTILDYGLGILIAGKPNWKFSLLWISVILNLGMLSWFKYFNFFVENMEALLVSTGVDINPVTVRMFLPVGISFYTFQSMSYTIDVYRGHQQPCRNLINFSLYVSFFPQLVAGPIERARQLLPQIEAERRLTWQLWNSAWPLLVRGYLKKLVIADNVAMFADKAYDVDSPTAFFLAASTLAFSLQLLADWSGYTDIARGAGRLFGVNLSENFRSPYLAISPSDFWRRWHISFMTWMRDYLFIPLGGSRVSSKWRLGFNIMFTLFMSGLWHGAAWNYVSWGFFHGLLMWAYHLLGLGGNWRPQRWYTTLLAWAAMFFWVNVSYLFICTPDMAWLIDTFSNFGAPRADGAHLAPMIILFATAVYSIPMFVLMYLDRWAPPGKWLHYAFYAVCVVLIILFRQQETRQFMYFQF